LPELEKIQVVLFSDKASFLLGNDDRWLSYDPRTSPEQASKALAAIKPKGNTNMYAAFEAAFRYRTDGLDTIYLLSDGLTNICAGPTTGHVAYLKRVKPQETPRRPCPQTPKTNVDPPRRDPAAGPDQRGRLLLREPRRRRVPVGAGPRKRRQLRRDEQA